MLKNATYLMAYRCSMPFSCHQHKCLQLLSGPVRLRMSSQLFTLISVNNANKHTQKLLSSARKDSLHPQLHSHLNTC